MSQSLVSPLEVPSVGVSSSNSVSKPRRGRPPKAVIEAKKKPGKVGRPAGDTARIAEFKARLLGTTGTKVIDKVLSIAQNDEHPGQMAALKMCMDRLLPTSLFEKDAKSGNRAITINITGVGETKIVGEETESDDYIEMESDTDE